MEKKAAIGSVIDLHDAGYIDRNQMLDMIEKIASEGHAHLGDIAREAVSFPTNYGKIEFEPRKKVKIIRIPLGKPKGGKGTSHLMSIRFKVRDALKSSPRPLTVDELIRLVTTGYGYKRLTKKTYRYYYRSILNALRSQRMFPGEKRVRKGVYQWVGTDADATFSHKKLGRPPKVTRSYSPRTSDTNHEVVKQFIAQVLEKNGKPMHYKEIGKLLSAQFNVPIKGQNNGAYGLVHNVMQGNSNHRGLLKGNLVKRVGAGFYAFNFNETTRPINQIETARQAEKGRIISFEKGTFSNGQ